VTALADVPWMDWYQSLAKPSWMPEPRTIGLIWQVLYPVIIATFGFVFVQAGRGKIPRLVAVPFAIKLVANLGCTPTHFSGARSPITMPANTRRLCPRSTHDQPEAGVEQPDDHPQGNQFEHARKGFGILAAWGLPDQLSVKVLGHAGSL